MRIHFHDTLDHDKLPVLPSDWEKAAALAGGIGQGHKVSFHVDWDAVKDEVEVVVAPPYRLQDIDLHAAPKLRLVQSTWAGMDGLYPFDIIPAQAVLVNNRGVHGRRAGEYCAMAILMLTNRLPMFFTQQRAALWRREIGSLAAAKRLTVVGLGAIGGAAAKWGKALGMEVTGVRHGAEAHPDCDRTLAFERIDEVIAATDIMLLACPLTPKTEGLLSRARIAALPAGAGVVNVGRGRLVDQEALCDALAAGHLGGAVLDVFAVEPIPKEDRIWSVPNMVITPHMSADDPDTYNADTLAIFFDNLRAHLAGARPPTAVDRDKGY
jgi:phosphoglycerate dehydrogenase-like enzyme